MASRGGPSVIQTCLHDRIARVNLQRTVFARLYRRAPGVESLPWHREEPPSLLERAVAPRTTGGRALDLGCGEGVYAVYLAQQGFSVVGVDFVPAALDAARRRAEQAGVEVELREGDVVEYEAPSPFDVVLDSGCLHHLPRGRIGAYRSRLDEWLAPGGDYVLVHFAHRPRVLWVPKGPRHMTRDEAVAFFAPLELQAYDETTFDVPLPMRRMRAGVYWFSRPKR
jgi:2-polyprenyl-3-methyl-5-hydroxy-6-metoxy-1,4-benzoquinol methylase